MYVEISLCTYDDSCRGKFQIHNNLGTARTFDGIQAHLSTRASSLVPQAMGTLREILILEELPRLRIWPSRFVENPVTEDYIGLYFFAKDNDRFVWPFFHK